MSGESKLGVKGNLLEVYFDHWKKVGGGGKWNMHKDEGIFSFLSAQNEPSTLCQVLRNRDICTRAAIYKPNLLIIGPENWSEMID